QHVHSARDVAKFANHTLSAMESPAAGPLARVNADGTLTAYRRPTRRHTARSEFAAREAGARCEGGEGLPRVDIVHQYAGADAAALDAYVAAGAQGLVVVGFPPGTNTPAIEEAIAAHAQAGVTIVQASRAIRDPQILPRKDLAGRVINADLSPQHARILLMLALAHGYRGGGGRRVSEEYGRRRPPPSAQPSPAAMLPRRGPPKSAANPGPEIPATNRARNVSISGEPWQNWSVRE